MPRSPIRPIDDTPSDDIKGERVGEPVRRKKGEKGDREADGHFSSGNTIGWKHGMRSGRPFAFSQLPKGYGRQYRQVMRLRVVLEEAVLRQRGEITETEHSVIDSALQAQTLVVLCRKHLRDQGAELKIHDLVRFEKMVMDASTRRTNLIKQLRLDVEKEGLGGVSAGFYDDDDLGVDGDGDEDGEDDEGDGGDENSSGDRYEANSEGSKGSDGPNDSDFEGL